MTLYNSIEDADTTYTIDSNASDTSNLVDETLSTEQKLHRFSILKMRILHLLKSWHSFVMTTVIHAENEKFSKTLHKAKTLDDIIRFHDAHLSRVCSLCLLND